LKSYNNFSWRFDSIETRKLFAETTPKFGKVTVARYEFGKQELLNVLRSVSAHFKNTLKRKVVP